MRNGLNPSTFARTASTMVSEPNGTTYTCFKCTLLHTRERHLATFGSRLHAHVVEVGDQLRIFLSGRGT